MWKVLQPDGWIAPKGYSNGIATRGRHVYLAGLIGWNHESKFDSDDFVLQSQQALRNIVDTLACAEAGPEHIVRMTWYVKDKQEYLICGRELGQAYKNIIGRHYPVMTLVQVVDLAEDRARVEIEVTAVIPD